MRQDRITWATVWLFALKSENRRVHGSGRFQLLTFVWSEFCDIKSFTQDPNSQLQSIREGHFIFFVFLLQQRNCSLIRATEHEADIVTPHCKYIYTYCSFLYTMRTYSMFIYSMLPNSGLDFSVATAGK